MFQIENGREAFFQWDINQRIIVNDDSITELHYCNKTDSCSLVTKVYKENGINYSDVPNILLQNNWRINVYGWDINHTKHYKCFKVNTRSKPANYIYTETEIFTVEKAVKEEADKYFEGVVIPDNLENGKGEKSILQKTVDEKLFSTATGAGAVALGAAQRVSGEHGVAINFNNKVYAKHGFAINSGNTIEATAEGAFVAGHGNVAKKSFQTVLGNYAEVADDDIFAVGSGNSNQTRTSLRVNRNDGVVSIDNLNAYYSNATFQSARHAYNDYTKTDKLNVEGEATIGNAVFTNTEGNFNPNEVTAEGCMAFGGSNTINGRNGVTLLTSNTIPEGCESVFIAGHKNTANSSHQYIFGTYCQTNPDGKDLFIIGNGEKKDGVENNKSAFVVRRDGEVIAKGGKITIGNTTITEAQLQKLLQLI